MFKIRDILSGLEQDIDKKEKEQLAVKKILEDFLQHQFVLQKDLIIEKGKIKLFVADILKAEVRLQKTHLLSTVNSHPDVTTIFEDIV